jgi:hypothetical protein
LAEQYSYWQIVVINSLINRNLILFLDEFRNNHAVTSFGNVVKAMVASSGKAKIRPFAEARPLRMKTQNLAQFVTLATLTFVQTFIKLILTGAPPRIREL